uniref:Uncharacterized protein n=1 Tax=Electrophorus electricus TaxID=8005 RepID=A0AAY5F428_ELEEL
MEYHSTGTLPLLGSPRYCPGANSASGYLCQTGHCCGETGCCTYYYELWWFWLLWSVLILFSCCCAYRHRQAKQRVRHQQRQREINLMAYHGACSYPSSMLDLSFLASLKLPSYEEVAAQPSTPPPPYSSVAYPRGSVHPGPSHVLSSQSSDNYTSCSCDSCCPSSPCSSSPSSAQLTDETDTSHASTSMRWEEPAQECPPAAPPQSPPRPVLFSPGADFLEPDRRDSAVCDLDVDQTHFQQRRLTGDSGIEVCRCRIDREEDEDEDDEERDRFDAGSTIIPSDSLHDSADCSD